MVVAAIALGLAIRHVHQWDLERENSLFRADVAALNNEVNLRTSYLDALGPCTGSAWPQKKSTARNLQPRLTTGRGICVAYGRPSDGPNMFTAKIWPVLEAESRQEPLNHFRVFDFDERSGEVRPPAGDSFMVIRHIQPMQNNPARVG